MKDWTLGRSSSTAIGRHIGY